MLEDFIIDRCISALIQQPRTFTELFALAVSDEHDEVHLGDIDEVLDILFLCNALQEFHEARHGERIRIFGLKSEARTLFKCEQCKGTGFQQDAKRGLCQHCKGNGVYTPDPLKHEVYIYAN